MNIVQPDYPAPAFAMTPRNTAQIIFLIIHHSDGPPTQTVLDIDAEHRGEGWAMIGYSYIIAGDGTIYKGRPDNVVPAAAQDLNTDSVDVCLLGDFQPGTAGASSPTSEQIASLKALAVWLHQQYPTINDTIGHRDVSKIVGDPSVATACPGDTLYALIPEIKDYVTAHLGGH